MPLKGDSTNDARCGVGVPSLERSSDVRAAPLSDAIGQPKKTIDRFPPGMPDTSETMRLQR